MREDDKRGVVGVIKMRKMTPSEEEAKRFGSPRGGRGLSALIFINAYELFEMICVYYIDGFFGGVFGVGRWLGFYIKQFLQKSGGGGSLWGLSKGDIAYRVNLWVG